MGAYHFRLPDVGEGVAEAEIVVWHVKPGDVIKEDQSLVDVMTDKATVDMTSPVDGTVVAVYGDIGQMMPVGSTLVELAVEGEGNVAGRTGAQSPPTPVQAPETVPVLADAPQDIASRAASVAPAPPAAGAAVPPAAMRQEGEPPLASPATRKRAYERGISLQFVPGTGPAGRITPADLDAYIAGAGMASGATDTRRMVRDGTTEKPIIGIRRKIAEKMQDAKRRIPHITYVEECDLTELEALRLDLNAHRNTDQVKLTLLPFLITALVRVLPDFPHINARFDDDAAVLHEYAGIHVGIATQTPAGLIVPVIRHAEARDIWDIAAELSRLSSAARDGRATRAEMSGSTITVTSLGPLGGITTTPIINHPEVAIIGPNKLVERPTVQGSFVTVRKMMNLSSSFDHRIVDGYDAARFIQAYRRLLEHPALIFME